METNEQIERLCELLSGREPLWDKILDRVRGYGRTLRRVEDFEEKFRELHLITALNHLAVDSDLDISFERMPTFSGNYVLHKKGEVYHVSSVDGEKVAVHDAIAYVDEVPVIFETTPLPPERLLRALQNQDERLEPARQLFGRDIGEVVMVPADAYMDVASTFERMGGHAVPLYTTQSDFRKQTETVIKENKFPVMSSAYLMDGQGIYTSDLSSAAPSWLTGIDI